MSDILIRHVPEKTLRQAKKMASRHKRSLQEEIRSLLVRVVETQMGAWSTRADHVREGLSRRRRYSNTEDLLRADRDR